MFGRFFESLIKALEQFALALTELLKVQEDEDRVRVVKMFTAAITSIAIAFIIGLVFVLSLVTISGQGIDQKVQQTLSNLFEYFFKVLGIILGSSASFWGAFKAKKYLKKKSHSDGSYPPPTNSIRLATGDEDSNIDVLKNVIATSIKELGKDVSHSEKGTLSTFKRSGKTFARIYCSPTGCVRLYGTIKDPKILNDLSALEGCEVNHKNTWGNLIFNVLNRGDAKRYLPWIENCYVESGKLDD